MDKMGAWLIRNFRYLTPRYIINRIAEIYYHKEYPDHPWLTKNANTILGTYLKKSDIGLEFGSGRSTVWFAKGVKKLTSVEHNEFWYQKVRKILKEEEGLDNVDYYLLPEDVEETKGDKSSYVKVIN